MKRILTLSAMFMMFVAVLTTTSCSTEKSITSAFAKTGYQMGMLTPQQQLSVAPMLSAFPEYNQTALGYLVAGNTITVVYNWNESAWNSYTYALTNTGFSNLGTGFARADRAAGYTFNVSSAVTEIYGQQFQLVTFAAVPF